MLQVQELIYIACKQVATVCGKGDHQTSLPSLVHNGRCFVLSGLAKTQKLSAVRDASHAASVLLEAVQSLNFESLILLSAPAASPVPRPASLCTDSALRALARVAVSEGSHTLSCLAVSPSSTSASKGSASKVTEPEAEVCATTVLQSCLLPASLSTNALTIGQANPAGGSAVVSGGLGGLGLLSSGWMVQQGWQSLLLLGRSGRASVGHSWIQAATAEVTMARCDVAAASEVAGLGLKQRVTDVLHAGGILRDSLIGKQTATALREVFAPKATGLQKLRQRFSAAGGRMTVFSSIAGVLGSAGQANYAAANSFMDEWADGMQAQVCLV